jgi:hypothetical protein
MVNFTEKAMEIHWLLKRLSANCMKAKRKAEEIREKINKEIKEFSR